MYKLPMILLCLALLLTNCGIEAVNPPGNGGNDSTAFFKDVSDTNIPADNLAGNSMDAKAADLDGDGDNDLVIAVEFTGNKILINDGTGVFTDETANRLPAKNFDSEDIAIADFNGDGSLDIFIVSEDNQTNEYYLNNGNGTFTDVGNRIPVTGISNAVLTSDINRNGFPDIIIGNNGQNVILINNGNGFFTNQTTTRLPSANDITQDLARGDIDNDGDLDLLVANEDNNRLYINNDGNGFFINRTQTRLPLTGNVEETREVDLADIDGDDDLDLYFANVILFQSGNSAQDRLLVNNQGSYTDVTQSQMPAQNTNTLDADFFDIDRDGDFDIVAGDFGSIDGDTENYTGTNFAKVFINDGAGFYTDRTSIYFPTDFSPKVVDFEIADFNGDGLFDIYVANFSSRDVLLLQQAQ